VGLTSCGTRIILFFIYYLHCPETLFVFPKKILMQTNTARRSHNRRNNTGDSPKRGHFSQRRPAHARPFPRRQNKRVIPTFDPTQFINKNPREIQEVAFTPKHRFADFHIDERLKETIASMGIKTPSPIQDEVIPMILDGEDVIGLAETGTGKTAAFLIPLIERKKKDMRATTLILTPTRELAQQIDTEFKKLSRNFRMFSVVCVGGTSISPQIRQLKKTNQFIIGTPGRVKDLMNRKVLFTDNITSVVLDEADRMLDMGFVHDMREILGSLPSKRHTLFFSATMDGKTKELTHEFTKDPVVVSVKKKDVTDSIEQDVVRFAHSDKFETLANLLHEDAYKRVIVFGAMKHSVEKLGKELNQHGIPSESIHGNKNHSQRKRSLDRFKSGQVRVLVATDVAARGIHVDEVSHVINYDLPNTFEDYVHRIGRTGRGSKAGKALTFIPNTTHTSPEKRSTAHPRRRSR